LLEAIDSDASEWRINDRKQTIIDEDRRHFMTSQQLLRLIGYEYLVLYDQFSKNAQFFQNPSAETDDRNFYT
jgi:hypothetical protein